MGHDDFESFGADAPTESVGDGFGDFGDFGGSDMGGGSGGSAVVDDFAGFEEVIWWGSHSS